MMPSEIQMKIFEHDKIIDTVKKETSGDLTNLIKSLEEFRQSVNEKLTQKVDDDGHVDDYDIDEELISSGDEDEKMNSTPKKRKT